MGKLDEALEFVQKAAQQAHRGWDEGTWDELEEEKNREKASFIGGLEPLLAIATLKIGEMVQFDKDIDFGSTEMYMFHALDKIDKFDSARIGSAVKKALDLGQGRHRRRQAQRERAQGRRPRQAQVPDRRPTRRSTARRSTRPRPSARSRSRRSSRRSTPRSGSQLGNGMNVVLLPINAMPLVTARLVFKNAGDAATPDNPALGAAAANFLHRVGDMDPSQSSNTDVFSRTGIEIQCGSTDDATVCGTHGVNIYLDVMVKGLERLIVAGEYTQEQIERWQKRTKERLQAPQHPGARTSTSAR